MAILAAVLMACTAFVLLADSSEADSYNDAAAFRTAMNPRIADAPGAFDVTINAGDPLPAISAGQTVLVKNGATLDCGAGITLTDCKIYFEAGDATTAVKCTGNLVLKGAYQVVFGYKEGTTNGFTVNNLGSDATVLLPSHGSISLTIATDSVKASGDNVSLSYGGKNITLGATDKPASFAFTDTDNWDMTASYIRSGSTTVYNPELKYSAGQPSSSGSTTAPGSGTSGTVFFAAAFVAALAVLMVAVLLHYKKF